VIPYANLKFVTLYSDIYVKKPAFDLKEGVFFTHIPNYAIKVGRKNPDGKTIYQVLIYEQGTTLQDNCIIAEKGIMKISEDEKYLEFNLENGFRYQERGSPLDTNTEYIRLGFKQFKKLFDLSVLQKQQTNDSVFRNNYKMLSSRQLTKGIDSLERSKVNLSTTLSKQLTFQLRFSQVADSLWKQSAITASRKGDFIPDSARIRVRQTALNKAADVRNTLQSNLLEREAKEKDILFHRIEWHRKFALSLACLILFFIGAPLGSIIRKGGLGLPLVIAIVFFLIFHLLNMFGEKFVKQGIMDPFPGMWLAILVLMPVGAFFTYKAMHDSQLFNKEFYTRVGRRLKSYISTLRKKSATQST
jgi:lipopolysaccharide export system permease protein